MKYANDNDYRKGYIKMVLKAQKLVNTLRAKCTPETICENYGQNAISKFEQKYLSIGACGLDYSSICNIRSILRAVSSITPKE